ncbi:MAG: vitamin B12 dependent-methionine synthase activation domain-containing protein [Thermodesulfobacteriota bacterium]|nr:vitamin B12 dependent-methionine synthase activation domain-containing protein [Thermodesulfobacteriota bacterium]
MESTSIVETVPNFEKNMVVPLLDGMRYRSSSRHINLPDMFEELITPYLYYRIIKIDHITKRTVSLRGGLTLNSPILAKVMKNCEYAVCFIATIGSDVEGEITRLSEENHLSYAYMLDTMGSTVIENMVDNFHKSMGKRYWAKGGRSTLRFSPGYCDWDISEQEKLFRALDSNHLDVELTDSCLMQPRKSISGIFGVLSSSIDPSAPPYNPCSQCKKKNCPSRRN